MVQLDGYSETHHEMSSLLVVVKFHLFPQFVQLNRGIGTGRGHWGDGEFAAVNRGSG